METSPKFSTPNDGEARTRLENLICVPSNIIAAVMLAVVAYIVRITVANSNSSLVVNVLCLYFGGIVFVTAMYLLKRD